LPKASVTAWYVKAAQYIKGTQIKVGFVSTNSITQGEQPGIFWPWLFQQGIKIHFGHRTFNWQSEARGRAHVHVVIIGFGAFDISQKRIFDYANDSSHPVETFAKNISPYLIDGQDFSLQNRSEPICKVQEMVFGNMPNDDSNFLFTDEEKIEFLKKCPEAKEFIKPFLSAKEYLNGQKRWCLWLKNADAAKVRALEPVMLRVAKVKKYRLESNREATKKLALVPMLFGEIRQPKSNYVLIPRHSSETRIAVPMSYCTPNEIVADSCLSLANASRFDFGILMSQMHMAWLRVVCGRIKSDYRYSIKLVYNNYPWPTAVQSATRDTVVTAAQGILDARAAHPKATLADLYDPLTMPPDPRKAHAALDKAVDRCYRKEPFESERERVEFLFGEYQKLVNPLGLEAQPKAKKKKVTK